MICKLVQYKVSTQSVDALSARVQTHLSECKACGQFRESMHALDSQLRAGAISAPRPVTQSPAAPPRLWWMGALACASAAILLAWVWQPGNPHKTESAKVAMTSPHSGDAAHAESSWGLPDLSAVAPDLSMVASADPLQDELHALRQDGERGLEALMSLGRRGD